MFLLSLPGCQLWNNWLEFCKWKDDKYVPPRHAMVNPNVEQGAMRDMPKGESLPQVTVFKITVPVGTLSANDKVWQQLNEDVLDSKTSVLLAQNGLRAGGAPLARWPAVSKLIDVPGAATEQFLCQTNGRSSLSVVTRPNVTEQIVVSIDRDLQQQGRTFEKCDNGFRLSMRGFRGKPDLLIQLEPVVTMGTIAVVRSAQELGVTRSAYSTEESFPDLRMAASILPDHFFAVAAADPKNNRFSIGSLWLAETGHAPQTETILVFVPTPPPPAAAK